MTLSRFPDTRGRTKSRRSYGPQTKPDVTGYVITFNTREGEIALTQEDIEEALGYNPEPELPAADATKYWRGDRTWVTLDKIAVGLSNVDNTSDAAKPISTATQTALNTKEPTISTGTVNQYWRGDKTWQTLDKNTISLGNVDNTADSVKVVFSAGKLTTPVLINGLPFDGSADLDIGGLPVNNIFLFGDAPSPPAGPPVTGGYLYSDAGALYWMGSSGTSTLIAPA